MKKIISIILLCSLFASLIACSSDEPGDESTETTDIQTDAVTDEIFGDLDYEGKTVNVLTRTQNSFEHGWIIEEICVEELTGDPVNTAIYNRNAAVEELLGVKIEQTVQNDKNKLKETVNSGDSEFDIVAVPSDIGVGYIYDGLMRDLYGSGIDTYLNTESSWWAQNWIDEAEVNGRLCAITGAPSLNFARFTMVMFYNKTLGNNLKLADPYEVVNSGNWTIDYVNEIISGIYLDLDNDDSLNGNDRVGIAINPEENCNMFWSAFDMDYISKDDDGWYKLNTEEKDKISSAFDKIFTLINESPDIINTIDNSGLVDTRDWFSRGTVLLAPLHLKYGETQCFRYMSDEYAVLPLPKYDQTQDDYYSYVQEQYSIFMIPKSASDPVMSGAVLEAMARESAETVRPAYYDSVLKGKYTRDEETRQVIDKIIANVKIDAAWIYGSLWNKPATAVFSEPIDDGNRNFDACYSVQERIVPIILKEFKNNLEAATADE